MEEQIEEREAGTEVAQSGPAGAIDLKFTLTEPDQIDDGNGDWGFTILADKDVFLASVSYISQADAIRGRIAMAEALKDAISIATSES